MTIQPFTPIARLLIVLSMAGSSCSTSHFVTNLNTSSNAYLPMPVRQKDEPNKSETYAGLHINSGFNNDYWGDYYASACLRLAQAHALGPLRLAYAGNVMLGGFYVGPGDYAGGDISDYRHANGGKLLTGAIGGSARISYARYNTRKKGEWRIGLEGAAHKEFGDYWWFRKKIPANMDLGVETSPVTYTAGIFSEWVLQKKKGQFGFKLAGGLGIFKLIKPVADGYYDYYAHDQYQRELTSPPLYMSFTLFQRVKRFIVFEQANVGIASFNFQYGVLFQLTGKQ